MHWLIPAGAGKRAVKHCIIDVNWWKSFVYARLATAIGDSGALQLYGDSPDRHQMLADHILGGRLVSVQNQFSPAYRSSLGELEYCVAHEIAFLPWSPLGGIGRGTEVFHPASTFTAVATELGVSPQRVALAWELSLGHCVIPIPGATRPETITDSAGAAELVLSADQRASLSAP